MARARSARLRPGAIRAAVAVALATATAAAGIATAAAARARSSPLRAEMEGLELQIERAVWVGHERDGSGRIPHAHLPGMPGIGFDRLAVTFALRNRGPSEQTFIWQSLVLRSEATEAFADTPDLVGGVVVPPGRSVVFDASFDVHQSEEPLTLSWQRGATGGVRLLETRTPVHPDPVPPREWPRLATALPRGRAAAGERLFHGRLACASCHGDPRSLASAGSAPHLGGIGIEAERRVRGVSAAQYLYESILDPRAFDARPAGTGIAAAAAAPPMPFYGEVLSLQEAADLVAYLLEQRRAPER